MSTDNLTALEATVVAACDALLQLRSQNADYAARVATLELQLEECRQELGKIKRRRHSKRLDDLRLRKLQSERQEVRTRLQRLLESLERFPETRHGVES